MEEGTHLQHAIQISEHIEECLSVLNSSAETLHLSIDATDSSGQKIDLSSLALTWKKVTFKLSSQYHVLDPGHVKLVDKIVTAIEKLMLVCFNTYALEHTFALYEVGFELLVNILILFQLLRDISVQTNKHTLNTINDISENAGVTLVEGVKSCIFSALEHLSDVYDALLRVIPTLEYLTAIHTSGNLSVLGN
eukprot:GHVR01073654.1.p1 GENE.GHVR01073654.1~~GHVR01073654.1.p1  ORF type:complete len:193 (+),score=38.38 GHVR01073654.1:157-735(+)